MRNFALNLLVGASVAVFAAPAGAQEQSSSSRADNSQTIFDVTNKEADYFEHIFRHHPAAAAESYAASLRFAACVAKLDPDGAAAVLRADAGSDEEQRAIKSIVNRHRTCALRRESVSAMFVRSAIAETIWKAAGADPNPAKRASVDISDVEKFIVSKPLGERAAKAGGMPISWVARCQVMAFPDLTAKVLTQHPGSDEENAEANRLYAKSQVCGVAKGLEKTPAIEVRASLADALYRNMVATK